MGVLQFVKKALLVTVLLIVAQSFAHAQIVKGSGVIYYDNYPNTNASLPYGSELAWSIGSETLYYWDRDASTWRDYLEAQDTVGAINVTVISELSDTTLLGVGAIEGDVAVTETGTLAIYNSSSYWSVIPAATDFYRSGNTLYLARSSDTLTLTLPPFDSAYVQSQIGDSLLVVRDSLSDHWTAIEALPTSVEVQTLIGDSLTYYVSLGDSTVVFTTPTQVSDSLANYLARGDSITLYVTPSQLSDSLTTVDTFYRANDTLYLVTSNQTFTVEDVPFDSSFVYSTIADSLVNYVQYVDSTTTFVTPSQLIDSLSAFSAIDTFYRSNDTLYLQTDDETFTVLLSDFVSYGDSLTTFVTPTQMLDSIEARKDTIAGPYAIITVSPTVFDYCSSEALDTLTVNAWVFTGNGDNPATDGYSVSGSALTTPEIVYSYLGGTLEDSGEGWGLWTFEAYFSPSGMDTSDTDWRFYLVIADGEGFDVIEQEVPIKMKPVCNDPSALISSIVSDSLSAINLSGYVEYADSTTTFVTPTQLNDGLALVSGVDTFYRTGDTLRLETPTDTYDALLDDLLSFGDSLNYYVTPYQLDTAITNNSLWTQSGSDIYYNSGNVGIGRVPIAYATEVNGSLATEVLRIYADGDDANSPNMYITERASPTANRAAFYIDPDGNDEGGLIISNTGTSKKIMSINVWNADLDSGASSTNIGKFEVTDSGVVEISSLENGSSSAQDLVLFVQDNDNQLVLDNSGTIGIGTNTPAYALDINRTGAVRLPRGTTAQQVTGADGVIRYNTDTDYFEGWNGLSASYDNLAWESDVVSAVSGTSGRVAFYGASGLTEDANLTWDGAAFGIGGSPGTTSPLNIRADGSQNAISVVGTGGSGEIEAGSGPDGIRIYGDDKVEIKGADEIVLKTVANGYLTATVQREVNISGGSTSGSLSRLNLGLTNYPVFSIQGDDPRTRLRGPITFLHKSVNPGGYALDSYIQPNSVRFEFSDAIKLPYGTTLQRPSEIGSYNIVSSFRHNTDLDVLEYVQNDSTWQSVASQNWVNDQGFWSSDSLSALTYENGLYLSNDTLSINQDSLDAWSIGLEEIRSEIADTLNTAKLDSITLVQDSILLGWIRGEEVSRDTIAGTGDGSSVVVVSDTLKSYTLTDVIPTVLFGQNGLSGDPERFGILGTPGPNKMLSTNTTADTMTWKSNFGNDYISDADLTITFNGYNHVVRSAVSGSPGSDNLIVLPAPSSSYAGAIISITASDADESDTYQTTIQPASGNIYATDGSVLGTTDINNGSLVFQCLQTGASTWAWFLISRDVVSPTRGDFVEDANLTITPADLDERSRFSVYAICSGSASANVEVKLPTATASLVGREIVVAGEDANGTYNIVVSPVTGSFQATNGGTQASYTVSSAVLTFHCMKVGASSYAWVYQ